MNSTFERRCRNCGAAATDAYCSACGQDTREQLPTFGQFAREATGRYVALDGRLWKTLAGLLLRPGFLTREYLAGHRRRYIGPARLFLVASLILFAVLRIATDWMEIEVITVDAQASRPAPGVAPGRGGDTEIDLALGALSVPADALGKRVERFGKLPREQQVEQVVAGMLRYGPYAMFGLLPAFALVLKALYIGGRHHHPARPRLYGEHLVFAAHSHAFLALMLAVLVVVPLLFVRLLTSAWIATYLLLALRNAYGGSWTGIVVRAAVMVTTYLVLFALATVALLVAAVVLR